MAPGGERLRNATAGAAVSARPNSGVAGVGNFGDGEYWTGHPLAAANSYGFGRLAWSPIDGTSRAVTAEWADMTFGNDPAVTAVVVPMLLSSWSAFENYTSPLGVGYIAGACAQTKGEMCCPTSSAGTTCPAGFDHYWVP